MFAKVSRVILVTGFVVLLSGCSGVLTDGDSSYGCPGMPSGVQCMSARDVLALTQGRSTLATAAEMSDSRNPVALRNSSREALSGSVRQDVRSYGTLPVAFAPPGQVPIRSPSQVMRVWIAPYEDVSGDLVMPGHLFTEVTASRWTIGTPVGDTSRHLKPLQPPPMANGSADR